MKYLIFSPAAYSSTPGTTAENLFLRPPKLPTVRGYESNSTIVPPSLEAREKPAALPDNERPSIARLQSWQVGAALNARSDRQLVGRLSLVRFRLAIRQQIRYRSFGLSSHPSLSHSFTNLWVCLQLRQPDPDIAKINWVISFFVVGVQGTMQVLTIVMMARFVTGL